MTPKRIQMTRQRPWRADHPDAVIVARPSKWGNPFRVGGFYTNRTAFHSWPQPDVGPMATRWTADYWTKKPYLEFVAPIADRALAVALFRRHIAGENVRWDLDDIRAELAGKDLACWCPLDQPCHASVLIELANGDTPC